MDMDLQIGFGHLIYLIWQKIDDLWILEILLAIKGLCSDSEENTSP